jgi:hypothetical protein
VFVVPFSAVPSVTISLHPPEEDSPLIDATLIEVSATGFTVALDAAIPEGLTYSLRWRAVLG